MWRMSGADNLLSWMKYLEREREIWRERNREREARLVACCNGTPECHS